MTHVYSTAAYAEAFAQLSNVVQIDCLGIWAQVREIAGTPYQDAIGLYPLCAPSKPASTEQLRSELTEKGLVSLVLVTDPFIEDGWFADTFDVARPYKTHHIVKNPQHDQRYTKHHRYEVRVAQRLCRIGLIELADYIDEWCGLYDQLITRHGLTGLHRFSRRYFESLATMPEMVCFGAFAEDDLVSASLWAKSGDHVFSHLAASSEEGYRCRASYGIADHMIRHFAGVGGIDFGGSADDPPAGRGARILQEGLLQSLTRKLAVRAHCRPGRLCQTMQGCRMR